ncbi:hypothetical protein [Aureisphaera galaxeae]|uniref:hypothetical protein n=1 Tax=Aureisphaera galaxeae TaxID=1538023 RepID=UPI002350F38C|nr:hypothetical protein [Aureisphaera galaxeae]
MRFKKIKASALQFAILVSVILALLLGSFITLTHTHQFFGIQSQLFLETISHAHAGMEQSLQSNTQIKDSIVLEQEDHTTILKKGHWGGFLTRSSTSRSKSKSFSQMALVGSTVEEPRTALHVADPQLPLVVVGDTKIEGAAYISDKGIKAGVISGHYYNGKELVRGPIRRSNGSLPELDSQWRTHTEQLLRPGPVLSEFMGTLKEKNTQSFQEPSLVIYEPSTLYLVQECIGNIILKSETEIVVSRLAKLTDVVLIAPKITIERGFKGNAHFLASESIKVNENVLLQYPSSLVILNTKELEDAPIPKGKEPLYISKNSEVHGNIIYLPKTFENHSNTNVYISEDTFVQGSIYVKGNLGLAGTVMGNAYTQRFVTNEFGSRYINHIYNGKLLGNDLPNVFCGLPFQNKKKGVVKWLY